MAVVNGVQPKILNVPTKSRELHAHVHPRDGNSAYFLIVLLTNFKDGPWRLVDIVQVEVGSGIVEILIAGLRGFKLRKA